MTDVIIIGAGPIGAYTAFQLASRGFDVIALDKQPKPGLNIICSGVIGKTAYKRYELPGAAIQTEIDAFTIISPQGQRLEYVHPETLAYIVDRSIFDAELVELARNKGARIMFNHEVIAVEQNGPECTVTTVNRSYKSRYLIIATGVNSRLHRTIGLARPPHYLLGAQIETDYYTRSESVQIHLGRDIAPGSFGWVIPLNNRRSRIGLLVHKDAQAKLNHMLQTRVYPHMDRKPKECTISMKPIAYGPAPCTVNKRVASVGEAAGQVKTTTGGCISFGLLCSEILCEKLSRSLKKGDGLEEYDLEWHSVLMPELKIGLDTRRMAEKLDDETLEKLFDFVKKNRFWVKTLVPRVNFDHHSDLLYYCLETFKFLLKK